MNVETFERITAAVGECHLISNGIEQIVVNEMTDAWRL